MIRGFHYIVNEVPRPFSHTVMAQLRKRRKTESIINIHFEVPRPFTLNLCGTMGTAVMAYLSRFLCVARGPCLYPIFHHNGKGYLGFYSFQRYAPRGRSAFFQRSRTIVCISLSFTDFVSPLVRASHCDGSAAVLSVRTVCLVVRFSPFRFVSPYLRISYIHINRC